MTTPQPAALPELPEPGYVREDGHDEYGYATYGRAYTADQMRARDAMWAERLAALQPQPAAADWQTPTTYAQRFTDAVALLCREMPPADMVAGWIDRASDDHRLQDWACERAPAWAQGIGLLDAAHVMADQPTEGVDHEPAQPAAAVSDEEIRHDANLPFVEDEHGAEWVTLSPAMFARSVRRVLALRPQAVPIGRDDLKMLMSAAGYVHATAQEKADFINGFRNAEAHHGITAQGAQGGEG